MAATSTPDYLKQFLFLDKFSDFLFARQRVKITVEIILTIYEVTLIFLICSYIELI